MHLLRIGSYPITDTNYIFSYLIDIEEEEGRRGKKKMEMEMEKESEDGWRELIVSNTEKWMFV